MKVEFYLTRLVTRTKESNMYASQKVFKLFNRRNESDWNVKSVQFFIGIEF